MSTPLGRAIKAATRALPVDAEGCVHADTPVSEAGDSAARAAVSAALHDPDNPDWLRNVQLAHQEVREDGEGAWECLCGYGLGDGHRLSVRHADHQADAVRAAILGTGATGE